MTYVKSNQYGFRLSSSLFNLSKRDVPLNLTNMDLDFDPVLSVVNLVQLNLTNMDLDTIFDPKAGLMEGES